DHDACARGARLGNQIEHGRRMAEREDAAVAREQGAGTFAQLVLNLVAGSPGAGARLGDGLDPARGSETEIRDRLGEHDAPVGQWGHVRPQIPLPPQEVAELRAPALLGIVGEGNRRHRDRIYREAGELGRTSLAILFDLAEECLRALARFHRLYRCARVLTHLALRCVRVPPAGRAKAMGAASRSADRIDRPWGCSPNRGDRRPPGWPRAHRPGARPSPPREAGAAELPVAAP